MKMLHPIQYTLMIHVSESLPHIYIASHLCVPSVSAGIIFGNLCFRCHWKLLSMQTSIRKFWVTLHVHSISGIDLYIDHYSMVEISLCIYSYLFSSDCMRDKLTIAVSETFHYISLTVYCMIKSLPVQVCNTHVCTSLYVCGCVHACACVSVRANVVFCENMATFLLKNNICTPDTCPEPGS